MVFCLASTIERANPGLLGALPQADAGLLTAGAVVFGVQRLVPTMDPTWYRSLKKPEWTPPNWMFPAVWIPLKLAQSVAAWLVWKSTADKQELALPLTVFGASLALGNWWNVVFMGRHQLQPSLKWMGAFWLSIAGTIAAFHPFSPLAAALVAPTQLWVTIAAKLNYDIVRLNKSRDSKQH
ncbi:hypothetical protein ABBQ38_013831 [Trebouxia sp. C0009 RCD-2024]